MNQKKWSRRAEALAGHYERKAIREARYAEIFQSDFYLGEACEAEAIADAYRAGMAQRVRDILPIRKFVETVWDIEDGLVFLTGLTLGGDNVDPDRDLDMAEEDYFMAS